MSQTQLVTPYNGEVWFRNIHLSSLNDLEWQLNDLKSEINNIRTDIMMIAIADPKAIASDNSDVLNSVKERVNDTLDDYADTVANYEMLHMISRMIDTYAVNNDMGRIDAFDRVVPDMFKDLYEEIRNKTKTQTNEADDR